MKVCLVPLTHETKYASGTMKFVDFLELGGVFRPQDSLVTGLSLTKDDITDDLE